LVVLSAEKFPVFREIYNLRVHFAMPKIDIPAKSFIRAKDVFESLRKTY